MEISYSKSVSYSNFYVWFHLCHLQADAKLREEEKRALRYLETRRECNSVQAVSVNYVLFCFFFTDPYLGPVSR